MADELNKRLGYDDEDEGKINLVAQGASVAGLITAGLGFPSLWRTINNHFPKGTATSLIVNPSPVEMTMSISRHAFEKMSDPESLAKVYTEAAESKRKHGNIIDEAERERTTTQKVFRDQRRMRDLDLQNIEQAAGKEKLDVIQDRIKTTEDEIMQRTHSRGTQYTAAEQRRGMIISKEDFLRKVRRATLQDYMDANEIKLNPFSKTVATDLSKLDDRFIDSYFENMEFKDKEISRRYLARLQGRTYGAVVADSYKLPQSFHLAPEHKLINPTNRPKGAMLDATRFVPFKPAEAFASAVDTTGKLGSKQVEKILASYEAVDAFTDKALSRMPWLGKGNYFKGTDQALKEVLHAFQDHVNDFNRATAPGGNKIGFKMAMEYGDRNKLFPQVAVTLVRDGKDPYRVIIPLPNEGRAVLPQGRAVGLTSHMPYRTFTNQPIQIRSSVVNYLSQVKRMAYKMVNDYKAGHRGNYENIDNLGINLLNDAYKLEPMEGAWLRNVHKTEKIHFDLAHQMTAKGRTSMAQRTQGFADWQIQKMHKLSGRDVVIYDQEYYMTNVKGGASYGSQVSRKNPHKSFPWQVSWRRMSASGEFIESKTVYVKTKELEQGLLSRKGKHYDAFVKSLEEIRQIEHLEYYRERVLSKKSMYEGDAIKHIHGKWDGAMIVDQHGKFGADRAILNSRSQTFMGRNIIQEGMAADLLEMRKALSNLTYGHGLQDILADTVRRASDKEVDQTINIFMQGDDKSPSPVAKFKAMLKRELAANPKNRREILIKAFHSGAHDAAVDVAGTYAAFNLLMKDRPLMGRSGTAWAAKEKFMKTGYMTAEQIINGLNKWQMSRHFIGEQASEGLDANYFNYSPTDVSQGALMRGLGNRLPSYYFNPFAIDNTMQKQTAQMFQGIPLFRMNSAGRMKAPFSVANEYVADALSHSSIYKDINRNASPALLKVAFVPKGSGFTPDSTSMVERSVAKGVYGAIRRPRFNYTVSEARSAKGLEIFGPLRQVYDRAVAIQNRTGERDLNTIINKILKKTHGEFEQLHNTLLTQTGKVADEAREKLAGMYTMEQNDTLIRNVKGGADSLKYGHFQRGRLVDFQVMVKNNKIHEAVVEYEKEIALGRGMPVKAFWGQHGEKVTLTEAKIDSILRPLTMGDEIVETQLAAAGRSNPIEAISEMNALGRAELGTMKRRQFMRIYEMFHVRGEKEQAKKFLSSVFEQGRMYTDRDGQVRISKAITSVDDALKVTNSLKIDQLYGWMKRANITWTSKSIRHMADWYGINYSNDWRTLAGRFDEVANRQAKEFGAKYAMMDAATKAATGQSVERQADNQILRYMKAQINPFYDYEKGKLVNAHKTPVARFWDFGEDVQGKRIVPFIGAYEALFANAAYEVQNKPLVNQLFEAPAFVVEDQMNVWTGMDKSTARKVMSRSKGAFRRRAASTMDRLVNSVVSGKVAEGRGVALVDDLGEVVTNILDFRKYNEIAREKVDQVKFHRKGSYLEFAMMVTGDAKDKITELEAMTQDPLMSVEKRASINKEIDRLKRSVSGVYSIRHNMRQKWGKSSVQYDIEENMGTIWEKMDRAQTGGHFFDDQKVNFGTLRGKDVKVAPYDLIMMKTRGFNPLGDDKFFEKVVNEAVAIAEKNNMGGGQLREELNLQFQMLRKQAAGKEGVLLTSPQLFQEVMGISYTNIDGKSVIRSPKMRLYENVLTAANEYKNAISADINAAKLESSYSTYLAELFNASVGKSGILTKSSFYMFEGQYGTAVSQQMVLNQAMEGWRDLQAGGGVNQIAEEIRIKEGKRVVGADIRKRAEKKYYDNMRAIKLLQDPTHNFLTKQDLHSYKIGGMNVKDWFLSKVKGGIDESKDLWKRIEAGEAPMLDFTARSPMRTHPWGMNTIKTYILDPDLEIFKGKNISHGGLIMSSLYFKMMGGDFDGDTANRMMINVRSTQQYGEILKEIHNRDQKQLKVMSEFWDSWKKHGNFDDARDALVRKSKLSTQDLLAVDAAQQMMLENGSYIKKVADDGLTKQGLTSGYTLEVLKNHERGGELRKIVNESVDLIDRFTKGESAASFLRREQAAYQNLISSARVIGDISSMSTNFELKMKHLRKFVFDFSADQNKNDLKEMLKVFKFFPGDIKTTAGETIDGIADKMFTDKKAFDQLTTSISSKIRGLAQSAISGKKMLGEGKDVELLNFVTAWKNIRMPESRALFSEQGIGKFTQFELATLGSFDIFDSIMKKNEPYARQMRLEYGALSNKGFGISHLLERSAEDVLMGMMGTMSGDEKKLAMSEYWGAYGVGKDNFATKASRAWGNTMKQMMFGKTKDKAREFYVNLDAKADKFAGMKKFIYEHNIGRAGLYTMAGLGLMQFLSPNGLDVGHSPGRGGESGDIFSFGGVGNGSLNPVPGEDPYSKQWIKVVKDNPALQDKMRDLGFKDYKDLQRQPSRTNVYTGKGTQKRRYVDRRGSYSKHYKTNDMRRAEIPGF